MSISTCPIAPLAADELELLRVLFDKAGLPLERYRLRPLQRRIGACLRALRVRTAEEARLQLERRPDAVSRALNAAVIGVSQFFRDPPVFARLREAVLPELARRPGRLTVWSAGCANGAELFSVAMLLAESGLLARSALLGTDCRRDAIADAQLGCYDPQQVLECVPAELRTRYFDPEGRQLRIGPRLRGAARWLVEDLFSAPPRDGLELVLCRNVAIYLDPGSTDQIWARITAALRPGGFLVVGRAERPPSWLPLLPLGDCTYRKRLGGTL